MLKNIYLAFCIAFTGSLLYTGDPAASDKSNLSRFFDSSWFSKVASLPKLEIIERSKREYSLPIPSPYDKKHSHSLHYIEQEGDSSIWITAIHILAPPHQQSLRVDYRLKKPFSQLEEINRYDFRDDQQISKELSCLYRQRNNNSIVSDVLAKTLRCWAKGALTHNNTMLALINKDNLALYRTQPTIGYFHTNPIGAFCKGDEKKIQNFFWALANRVRPTSISPAPAFK